MLRFESLGCFPLPFAAIFVTFFFPLRRRRGFFFSLNQVRVFEWAPPCRRLAVLRQHSAAVCGVAWSPDGKLLASAGRDGNIALWSLY